MTLSQVADDGTVTVMYMNNIKVEATWVTLSQVADDGTVSVMYMKQHKSRSNVGDTVTSRRSWDCQCYVHKAT